jgi:hypothetical protein
MLYLTKRLIKQDLKGCGRISFFMADPIFFYRFFAHRDTACTRFRIFAIITRTGPA